MLNFACKFSNNGEIFLIANYLWNKIMKNKSTIAYCNSNSYSYAHQTWMFLDIVDSLAKEVEVRNANYWKNELKKRNLLETCIFTVPVYEVMRT
jgi:hypothetical protein